MTWSPVVSEIPIMNGSDPTLSAIVPAVLALTAFLCLFFSLRAARRQRLLENTPTSKSSGVFIGLVELKGTAEAERPITSFFTEQACVHFSWLVEEHWSKNVTETYKDNKGRTQTRTRRESGWTTVAQGGETLPSFYLRDDCGIIQVRPAGARLVLVDAMNIECKRDNPIYYGKGPSGSIANTDNRRRFIERVIPLHSPLYVMGQARERQDIVAPEIANDPEAELFLISTKQEESVTSGYRWSFWGLGILGLLLAVGSCLARILMLDGDPANETDLFVVAGAVYLVIWFFGWVLMVYNSMVALRERVRQAWANVDVQLKRRNDLIPALVTAVTGLRDYEQTVQTEITHLRAQTGVMPTGQAGTGPQACSGALQVVVEKYPELKANQAFLGLHNDLIDTEQRISLARTYFNDIATFYNTRLTIIPDRFIAALGAMSPQGLMSAGQFERDPIHISLSK